MKITENRPKPVTSPPTTFTVELSESEAKILTVLLGQTSRNEFDEKYENSDQFIKEKLNGENTDCQLIYKMYVAFLNAVK